VHTLALARPSFAVRPPARHAPSAVTRPGAEAARPSGEARADAGPEAPAAAQSDAAQSDAAQSDAGHADAAHADTLAARAAAGDADALQALVTRYHARCLRFARNMGLAREDAEEAVQDAFVRMANALPRFRAGAAFEPWLFRILGNRCRSARVRARRWGARAVDASALDGVAAPAADALAALDAEQRRGAVLAALDALPAEQREAFLLRYVEEMDYAAMARTTGAGQSALKMRVKRACDALRARLGAAPAGARGERP
jgi:RNA polymerase sigma-70 factor (ECF subfamily)